MTAERVLHERVNTEYKLFRGSSVSCQLSL
jgi:hypothetical protein